MPHAPASGPDTQHIPDAPTAAPAAAAPPPPPPSHGRPTRKRRRDRSRNHAGPDASDPTRSAQSATTTYRLPPSRWGYLRLRALPAPSAEAAALGPSSLDMHTARLRLSAALAQSLGDHGAAIPVDLLALPLALPTAAAAMPPHGHEPTPSHTHTPPPLATNDVLLRVPRGDGAAVAAAVGAWSGSGGGGGAWGEGGVGWVVVGRGDGVMGVVLGDGRARGGGRAGVGSLFDFAEG